MKSNVSASNIDEYKDIESIDIVVNDDNSDIEVLESADDFQEPCPDSLVYGNINAKNYVIMRNNDKVRKLYFDDISLSIHNEDVSFIHTPNFKDENAFVSNRISFRIEDGLNYDGENYLRHFGIVAHKIDCFEIPDEIGSIFSEDNVALSNYREIGNAEFIDAEINMIADKHNQSLSAYFYDVIIVEKNNDKTELNATLHINNEALKINSGKLHYHSNPSPSPMAEKGLVIKLDSDSLNLFRFGNFKEKEGDYIHYQYLYRITEIDDEYISLKVFSFPANKAKRTIQNSFFPDAEDNIMQEYTTQDKLNLILEIENAPYTKDVELKGYSYNKYRALENNLHDVAYYDESETNIEEPVLHTDILKLNTDYNKRIVNQMDRREYKEWTEPNSDGYILTFWHGDIKEEVDNSDPGQQVNCQKIFQNIEKKADEFGINMRSPDVNPFENEKFYDILLNEIKAAKGGHELFKGFSTFREDMQLWQQKYCNNSKKRKPRKPHTKQLQLNKNGYPLRKDFSDDFKQGNLIAKFDKNEIILEASSEEQGKQNFEFEVPKGTIDVMQIGMAVASIEPKAGTEKIINVFHTDFTSSHSASSSYKWDANSDSDEAVKVKTIKRGRIYPKVSRVVLSVRKLNDRELTLSDKINDNLIAVDVKTNTNINGLILKSSYHFSENKKNEYKTVKTYLINKDNKIVGLTNPDFDIIFFN